MPNFITRQDFTTHLGTLTIWKRKSDNRTGHYKFQIGLCFSQKRIVYSSTGLLDRIVGQFPLIPTEEISPMSYLNEALDLCRKFYPNLIAIERQNGSLSQSLLIEQRAEESIAQQLSQSTAYCTCSFNQNL